MNYPSVLFWGFAATAVMTSVMSVSQGLGLSRMSVPFMVGTIFTSSRDRAMPIGVVVHFLNGLAFALVYGLAFELLHLATWWIGLIIGAVHGLFVLTVGMQMLPGMHPRMVSEYYGPTPNRRLQPPGFLALNYGRRTPLTTMIAHLAYGLILGAFYELAP